MRLNAIATDCNVGQVMHGIMAWAYGDRVYSRKAVVALDAFNAAGSLAIRLIVLTPIMALLLFEAARQRYSPQASRSPSHHPPISFNGDIAVNVPCISRRHFRPRGLFLYAALSCGEYLCNAVALHYCTSIKYR